MKKVYIAGKLNGSAGEYIQNMSRMIKVALEAKAAGFAVFVPCLDVLLGMQAGMYEYEDYFNNNYPWLEVSDAVFLVPGYADSPRTQKEIFRAWALNIPVCETIQELKEVLGG